MPHISTHVLDISQGRPAGGIKVELRGHIAVTNANGRTDEPLIKEDTLEAGIYRVNFHVGDYLRACGHDAPFYEVITIAFAITDCERNYHVPLLLAPHGYSTYLGS
jgi:5-hydroxyisourate hydrolase